MSKKPNEPFSEKNKEILKYIMSDLVPVIADELKIGFQEADEIIVSTDFYKALSSESVMQYNYISDNLLLILRKELARSEYPSLVEEI